MKNNTSQTLIFLRSPKLEKTIGHLLHKSMFGQGSNHTNLPDLLRKCVLSKLALLASFLQRLLVMMLVFNPSDVQHNYISFQYQHQKGQLRLMFVCVCHRPAGSDAFSDLMGPKTSSSSFPQGDRKSPGNFKITDIV